MRIFGIVTIYKFIKDLHNESIKQRREIREGKKISLDGILDEFKGLLKEALQTASEEELTAHLEYDKYQSSDNTNYRNEHSKKR